MVRRMTSTSQTRSVQMMVAARQEKYQQVPKPALQTSRTARSRMIRRYSRLEERSPPSRKVMRLSVTPGKLRRLISDSTAE